MDPVTYPEIVEWVDQLTPSEQAALLKHLQTLLMIEDQHVDDGLTLEIINAERQQLLAAGAFENVQSLRNAFPRPNLDLSFEELEAGMDEFNTAWEEELDDLAPNND